MMILPSIPVVLSLCHAYLTICGFWLSWGVVYGEIGWQLVMRLGGGDDI